MKWSGFEVLMMWSVDDQMVKAPKKWIESTRSCPGKLGKSHIICVGEKR